MYIFTNKLISMLSHWCCHFRFLLVGQCFFFDSCVCVVRLHAYEWHFGLFIILVEWWSGHINIIRRQSSKECWNLIKIKCIWKFNIFGCRILIVHWENGRFGLSTMQNDKISESIVEIDGERLWAHTVRELCRFALLERFVTWTKFILHCMKYSQFLYWITLFVFSFRLGLMSRMWCAIATQQFPFANVRRSASRERGRHPATYFAWLQQKGIIFLNNVAKFAKINDACISFEIIGRRFPDRRAIWQLSGRNWRSYLQFVQQCGYHQHKQTYRTI